MTRRIVASLPLKRAAFATSGRNLIGLQSSCTAVVVVDREHCKDHQAELCQTTQLGRVEHLVNLTNQSHIASPKFYGAYVWVTCILTRLWVNTFARIERKCFNDVKSPSNTILGYTNYLLFSFVKCNNSSLDSNSKYTSFASFLRKQVTFCRTVCGYCIVHQCTNVWRFASGRSTHVQHDVTRLWVQHVSNYDGRQVLRKY